MDGLSIGDRHVGISMTPYDASPHAEGRATTTALSPRLYPAESDTTA